MIAGTITHSAGLGDPYAPNMFLRNVLGYKRVLLYYVAMVIDPILRFNWIFYAIFFDEVQHSALVSFFIALSEIFRRGMWTLFRVEVSGSHLQCLHVIFLTDDSVVE